MVLASPTRELTAEFFEIRCTSCINATAYASREDIRYHAERTSSDEYAALGVLCLVGHWFELERYTSALPPHTGEAEILWRTPLDIEITADHRQEAYEAFIAEGGLARLNKESAWVSLPHTCRARTPR